jgi:membrane-bound ClpP family serine protease
MSFLLSLSAQLASWFFGIVISLLGIAFLYMLGQTGVSIRKGIETKKALNKIRDELAQEGVSVNEKWHTINQQASHWIGRPVVAWLLFYIGVLFLLPKLFLFSVLLLIVPVLGFFGIVFVPSSDPMKYL